MRFFSQRSRLLSRRFVLPAARWRERAMEGPLRACLWPPPAPSLPVCLFCFFSQAASLLPRAAGMPAGVVGAAALLGALGPGNGRCAWARVGDCGDDARRGPNFPRQWEQAGKEEEVEVRSGAWE